MWVGTAQTRPKCWRLGSAQCSVSPGPAGGQCSVLSLSRAGGWAVLSLSQTGWADTGAAALATSQLAEPRSFLSPSASSTSSRSSSPGLCVCIYPGCATGAHPVFSRAVARCVPEAAAKMTHSPQKGTEEEHRPLSGDVAENTVSCDWQRKLLLTTRKAFITEPIGAF